MAIVHTNFHRVIYTGKGGFAIFATRDGFAAKGVVLEPPEALLNTAITLAGEWEKYRGERTFAFKDYEVQTRQLYFFLTRLVGGIPTNTAKEIAETLGDDLDRVIDEEPETLLRFKGIGPVRLERIRTKWRQHACLRRLAQVLIPFGISFPMIARIAGHFGDQALETVSRKPYRLMEIRGIGFKTADAIALKLGMSDTSPERLRACLRYLLEEEADRSGSSAVPMKLVLDRLKDYPFSREQAELAVSAMLGTGELCALDAPEGRLLVLPWLYRFETVIFRRLRSAKPSTRPLVSDLQAWLEDFAARNGFVLGEEQVRAVELANAGHTVLAIAGYAGTGKTTTARAILELYRTRYRKIACCALSGVAANRLGQKTGFPAGTIHSLLGYDGDRWTYDAKNPLPYEVVLLDEASMVNSELFFRLICALPREAHLVLLGDPAQLPPVGPGHPFADLIRHRRVPTVFLERIYRQRKDQVIVLFARDVRCGRPPVGFRRSYGDWTFIEESIPDYFQKRSMLAEQELVRLREECNLRIQRRLLEVAEGHRDTFQSLLGQKRYREALWYFQVLSPMHKGELGARALNPALQDLLNPSGAGEQEYSSFRLLDKVIHLINANLSVVPVKSYKIFCRHRADSLIQTRRVFNGQLGVVVGMDSDFLHVLYPQEEYIVLYDRVELAQGMLDLAYCLTVHKAQGSEFEEVIMPVTTSHFGMLSPRLIYTAITRAKRHLTLIGQDYAFKMGVRKSGELDRRTVLDCLLAKEIEYN